MADAIPAAGLDMFFLDNTDPDGMYRVLESLPLEETLVVVISKSGGTPEKTPQKEFPSGYSNGASSGSRIVWRRVLLIAEGTFLWQTGTGI